jgi:NADPH2:quinone reductase
LSRQRPLLSTERAINYRQEDFTSVITQETQGRGVDVILDMVGGSYAERNQQVLAVEGRLVQIGIMENSKITLDLMQMMVRRQTITGSTSRARSVADKAAIGRALRDKVWPLLEAGTVKPVIDRIFPLAEAAEAHRLMESSTHIGKVLLTTG